MKSDKLLESTQKALQGKLQESWIKESDFIKSIELTFGKDSIVKSGNYWCTIMYKDLYFTITCDYKNDLLKTKEMDSTNKYEQPIKGDIFSAMKLNKKNLNRVLNDNVGYVIKINAILKDDTTLNGYYTGKYNGDIKNDLVTNDFYNTQKYSTVTQAQDDCKYIKEQFGIDFKKLNLQVEEI